MHRRSRDAFVRQPRLDAALSPQRRVTANRTSTGRWRPLVASAFAQAGVLLGRLEGCDFAGELGQATRI